MFTMVCTQYADLEPVYFKVICRLMLMEYVYFTMQMSSTYNPLHVSLSIASSVGELSSHNNVISSYAMLNAI